MTRQEALDYYLAMLKLACEQRQPTCSVMLRMVRQWANHWHFTAEEIVSHKVLHEIQPKEASKC